MRSVDVYCHGVKSGTVAEQSPGDYLFRYDDAYFADPSRPAISVTLPKRQQEYRATALFPFFANMLPEGHNRRVVCRLRKVDEDDIFGLLMAMRGCDFIGAVDIR